MGLILWWTNKKLLKMAIYSGLSHWKWWIFPLQTVSSPEGTMFYPRKPRAVLQFFCLESDSLVETSSQKFERTWGYILLPTIRWLVVEENCGRKKKTEFREHLDGFNPIPPPIFNLPLGPPRFEENTFQRGFMRLNAVLSTEENSTLWLFNIAKENGPFIDGLPIENCDFPWLC